MTTVKIIVKEKQSGAPISNAPVTVDSGVKGNTNAQGVLPTLVELTPGLHTFEVTAFGISADQQVDISGLVQTVQLELDFQLRLSTHTEDFTRPIEYASQGDVVGLRVEHTPQAMVGNLTYTWAATAGSAMIESKVVSESGSEILWDTGRAVGNHRVSVTITEGTQTSPPSYPSVIVQKQFSVVVQASDFLSTDSSLPVSLRRTQITPTGDQALWVAIRNRTKAISFSGSGYESFINKVLCQGDTTDIVAANAANAAALNRQQTELYEPIHGVGAYELLKTATQVFLLLECGPVINEFDRYTGETLYNSDEEASRLGRSMSLGEVSDRLTNYLGQDRLPYINRVLNTAFQGRDLNSSIFCPGILSTRASCPPLLELIWSYWHEEGMLVQTMNVISLRFQNRRSKASRDPLAHLEIAPLYPVNNLLWGYIQDEIRRLSVTRRNYEYNHHYGLGLYGQAVSDFRPADPRSRFLEGFHNLLYLTTLFYKQDDDTTVIADGFPILNTLREVHLLLAEGAHNQFGDLPWTARAEMLMQQWLLSRPEFREFLQSRAMVPYRESWMPQVDTMKQLQGWMDVSVTHFNFLAVYGEQILLSIRYGDWIGVTDPTQAANWARYWRPEIQGYIHAYRAATGVDLTAEARDSQQAALRVIQPSELLRQRLPVGQTAPALPAGQTTLALLAETTTSAPQSFRERRAARRLTSG